MPTFLFDKTVFGPVVSRRLGISLGINLLPNDRKLCTFDCIYCECGWNPTSERKKPVLPSVGQIRNLLETKLIEMARNNQLPDVITFAGNGEPTLHPEFPRIIEETIEIRNRFAPLARVAVLSNSTMLHKPEVVAALKKVDDNILKLDSGLISTIRLLNKPNQFVDPDKLVEQFKQFDGKLIIQTMFVKGQYQGQLVDNTTDEEFDIWLKRISEISPSKVMIYTIDRDTPAKGLIKVTRQELDRLAAAIVSTLGIPVDVSA